MPPAGRVRKIGAKVLCCKRADPAARKNKDNSHRKTKEAIMEEKSESESERRLGP
jgi:hypothetical protein